MSGAAVMLKSGEGRSVSLGPTRVSFKIESGTSKGASLVEFEAAPGFDTGMHVHERLEESFYVIDGEFEFHADADNFQATRGTCVFIPARIPHAFANRTDKAATLLLVMSPPSHDRYFDELASVLAGDGPRGDEIAALRDRYDTKQLSTLTPGRT
jgi:quercetin dioxygenase-like cupin family protein